MSFSLRLLAVLIALLEVAFVLFGDPSDLRLYRSVHLLEMVSLIAIVAVTAPASRGTLIILLALASAFLGDIVNSKLIDFSAIYSQQVLLSIPFFLLTHLLYLGLFTQRLRKNLVFRVVAALICVAVLVQLFGPDVGLLAMVGLAVYGVILLSMAFMALPFLGEASPAPLVAVGACVFVVSDCLISATLFSGLQRTMAIDSAIWLTYIYAQICISCVLMLPPRANAANQEAVL